MSQAAVNVATGGRYKLVDYSMIETALGVWGWEDAGVPWMNPEVRDRFLSQPNAKILAQKYERTKEIGEEEGSYDEFRKSYGLGNTSYEEDFLYHIMHGDAEIRKIRPPKTYLTGEEPLTVLIRELSKDKNISHLHLQTGKTVFDFRQS